MENLFPKVSIIIPNYNHEYYLKQRINSILNQTYQDFELIILDDKSVDNSEKVIEQYRNHPKVSQIIYNEVNSGTTFKQWRKGIEMSVGKYIWIAESDDWCEPNLLQTLVNGLNGNPRCVIAYCQSFTILNNETILWQSIHNKISEYIPGKLFLAKYMANKNTIFNASMAVFNKDAYLKISDNYMSFRFAGDWLFWIECSLQGDVFISAKPLNFFRKHDKDVSGKAYTTGYNYIEELKILQFLNAEKIISHSQYKDILSEKYNRFMIGKSNYTKNIQSQIAKLFYFNENNSYKFFLVKKYFVQKFSKKLINNKIFN